MNQADYMKTQISMIAAARSIENLDLQAFLRAIGNAETVAPILDPTLYRKAQANLVGLRRLAEALLPVQVAFRELRDTVIDTAVKGHMEMKAKENEV